MSLLLRDSIDAPLIPRDTPVVAGYGDGRFIWSPAWKASGGLPAGTNWWDLFPAAVKLVIVVTPGHFGDIADVEFGDFTPADAPGFVRAFNRPGRRAATFYCNRSTWPQIVDALVAAGLDPAAVDWWIGTLDGTTDLFYGSSGVRPPAGLRVVAIQTVDTGAYDESVIIDPSWVGLEEDMTPEQAAQLIADVAFIRNQMDPAGTGAIGTLLNGNSNWQLRTDQALANLTAQVKALQDAGVPATSVQPLLDELAALGKHLGLGTA